jgi:hypothetical protein
MNADYAKALEIYERIKRVSRKHGRLAIDNIFQEQTLTK